MPSSPSLDANHLRNLEAFCKAATLGNFSLAAQALGVTPGAVSRSVARIERRLGVGLFVRSTQGVRLTAAGEAYWKQCEPALAALLRAGELARHDTQAPEGTLRVTCSPLHAHYRVLPLLPVFRREHPVVDVQIDVSDRLVDFVGSRIDLALRTGEPRDDSLVYRTLEHCSLGIFAAPQYLARYDEPRRLGDLGRHRCITFRNPARGDQVLPWMLRDANGRPVDVEVPGSLQVGHDGVAVLAAALHGAGLCQVYHFAAEPHLRRGELVEVMRDFGGRTLRWSVVHPGSLHVNSRTRAFIDFLVRRVVPERAGAPPGRALAFSP